MIAPIAQRSAIPEPSTIATRERVSDARPMSFVEELARDSLATLRSAEAASIDGMNGVAPMEQVALRVMAAEQVVQAAIAIREKAVAAYSEITRMSI